MWEKIKKNWQEFRDARPGHRFRERYERRQQESEGKFNLGKIVNIVLGLAIAAAGIFLIPAPGPGSMIIFVGLGLIGSEFLPLAKFLDWAELRVRAVVDWAKGVWSHASLPAKAAISLALLVCAAGLSYGAYEMIWGGEGGRSKN